jgi:hypothetical protein
MPKGFPKKLFPGKYSAPAEGGAVGGGSFEAIPAPSVKEPIRDMLAPGTEEDFVSSLPETTSTEKMDFPSTDLGEAKPKRKYAKKIAEQAPENPLFEDKRYRDAIGRMNGLGGARVIKVGFNVTGKPLESEEESEIDDLFYVIGKRSKLDPGESWFILGLYALFLLIRLIVVRTEAGEALKKLFDAKTQAQKTVESKQEKAPEVKEEKPLGTFERFSASL